MSIFFYNPKWNSKKAELTSHHQTCRSCTNNQYFWFLHVYYLLYSRKVNYNFVNFTTVFQFLVVTFLPASPFGDPNSFSIIFMASVVLYFSDKVNTLKIAL